MTRPARIRRAHFDRALLSVVIGFLASCGKSPGESAQSERPLVSPEEEVKVEAQLIPAAAAKGGRPEERLEGAVHAELTMRLQMYIDRTGKVPESIYEFANTAVDSMPPAPPGMKYVLDAKEKVVKVVRK